MAKSSKNFLEYKKFDSLTFKRSTNLSLTFLELTRFEILCKYQTFVEVFLILSRLELRANSKDSSFAQRVQTMTLMRLLEGITTKKLCRLGLRHSTRIASKIITLIFSLFVSRLNLQKYRQLNNERMFSTAQVEGQKTQIN